MGISHRIYVGPYVRCENKPVEVGRQVAACHKPLCPAPGHESQFCSTCGSALIQKTVKEQRKPISAWDVREELRERLANRGAHTSGEFAGFDVWAPNVSWPGDPCRETNGFVGEEHVKDSCPPTERVLFEMAFKPEIDRLRAIYGEKNVQVRWGVIGEWM